MQVSYVLPIRVANATSTEMAQYLGWLASRVELIVVDGSPAEVYEQHHRAWSRFPARHVPPRDELRRFANGKVAGVLTGLNLASHRAVIIADDDVRYDDAALGAMGRLLDTAHVVRPQNYFDPVPWHACFDTARTLLNRVSGGDWPGTIGVQRATLIATRGYDGDVLFENLELVRTVIAAGGSEACPLDLYVRRLPPSSRHYWSQRVRQAYDEFARPWRLACWLAVLPLSAAAIVSSAWRALGAATMIVIGAAEIGRRRAGGARVFPFAASIAAPAWLCERAICAWLAVAAHVRWGGMPYRDRIIARAATPLRQLERRLKRA